MRRIRAGLETHAVTLHGREAKVDDRRVPFDPGRRGGPSSWLVNGRPAEAVRRGRRVGVHYEGRNYLFEEVRPGARGAGGGKVDPVLVAPMVGRVVQVRVREGDYVREGEAVVVVEAMKMEHWIAAPAAMRVREVRCREHDRVDLGQVLVVLEGESRDG